MEEKKESKLLKLTEEAIDRTVKDGITTNNLDIVYKLAKIKHMEKEDESMNYGNYNGRGPGHGSYGEYGNYGEYNAGGYGNYNEGYGRRGVDSRYRGYGHLDRMYNEYGNYSYGRERYGASGNYGAKEDSMKSLKYMLEATVDFFKMLNSEAESQEEKQLIRQYAQQLTQM